MPTEALPTGGVPMVAGFGDGAVHGGAAVSPDRPYRVLVVGDSTGVQLAEAMLDRAEALPDRLVVGTAAFGGCGLSAADDGRLHAFTDPDGDRELLDIGACVERYRSVASRIDAEAIDVVVVSIGPWDALDMHLADGRVVSVADPVGAALVADAAGAFVDDVRAAGATVLWVTPADAHLGWGTFDDPINDTARWQALRSIIDDLDVDQVDMPGWLAESGLDGPEGRPDGVHLAPGLPDRFVDERVLPALDDLFGH